MVRISSMSRSRTRVVSRTRAGFLTVIGSLTRFGGLTGRNGLAGVSIFISLAVSSLPAATRAGTIGEDFHEVLLGASPGNPVLGILLLPEQLDVAALEAQMDQAGIRTRWRRHERVVREAQALAQRTQGPLLSELRSRQEAGQIRRVQSFWIINAVAVEAPAETFAALSIHPSVHAVHANLPLPLKLADESPMDSGLSTAVVENGLRVIHAPEAWARGYTGRGSLVGHFDSGAFGLHEAFADRWRGAAPNVPWWEAWYDPHTGSVFPFDTVSHGTHVLGIMVAKPPDSEPLGVAYEASWIAAGALVPYDVNKILSAFEWAVDPDRDPSTIDDVPHALNHSWGTNDDCADTYWGALDVLEAAGIANVFAVANSGPSPASVNSPESRAVTPYRTFSVGAVDPHVEVPLIRGNSARGPSPCDDVSIKPEVAAPGTRIRSTLPTFEGGPPLGAYGTFSGTSMAAPHVTGAIALLFQANASLTTDIVKHALMTTAQDLGDAGEDNTYGWGLIDVDAALTWIETNYPAHPAPASIAGPSLPAEVIVLHWNPPRFIAPGRAVSSYRIYRAEADQPFPEEPIAEVPAFPTDYYDRGLSGEFRYVITAVYDNGVESEPTASIRATASKPAREAPADPLQASVTPNPFRDAATVRFALDASAQATVAVHSVSGALVRSLHSGALGAGEHVVQWDGTGLDGQRAASGTYFVRVTIPGRVRAERLVLLR